MTHLETHICVLSLALFIGVVAGLRSFTAPAVVSWAAVLHWINLDGTWASFMGQIVTVAILSMLLVGELVLDKLPKTPSRTAPPSFAFRLISGGFSGAVLGTAWGYPWSTLGAGVIGAALGTVGGYQARSRLAAAHGHGTSVALIEDCVAVLGGFAIAAITAVL